MKCTGKRKLIITFCTPRSTTVFQKQTNALDSTHVTLILGVVTKKYFQSVLMEILVILNLIKKPPIHKIGGFFFVVRDKRLELLTFPV